MMIFSRNHTVDCGYLASQDAKPAFACFYLLSGGETEIDMPAALTLAVENDISAYDAQFVTLAGQLAVPLITEDRRLIGLFPETAVALADYDA